MKRMIWSHQVNNELVKEKVLLIGVSFHPDTRGYDNTIYACIMDAEKLYHKVPIETLSLSTEDYNKIFCE